MQLITITQAKRDFYSLVNKASQGEEVTITKYGNPISKLVPFDKNLEPLKLLKSKK